MSAVAVELKINEEQALSRLIRFLSVEGITGQEKSIADAVLRDLVESGVARSDIKFDTVDEMIEEDADLPCETGNLIVNLPGTRRGPRLLFMSHLDTVPLCAGAEPERRGNKIISLSETALGGDNRTGVAVLATLAATLIDQQIPHPPITLLFTVREESGLWGARYVDLAELGKPVLGFNVDGSRAEEFTIGAVGAERWEVEIFGKASHAGVHPEEGISATLVGSLALSEVHRAGWFGKIVKPSGLKGTSNIGSFGGVDGLSAGDATNVVTDYAHIKGESRSHDPRAVKQITKVYRDAFLKARDKVKDHKGKTARVEFQSRLDYFPFRLREGSAIVKRALAAAKSAGFTPTTRIGNGGLDANWLVRKGLPTVTFGAGQHSIHTVEEYVDLTEFYQGCVMALALATYTE